MTCFEFDSKLVSFGSNGVNLFKESKNIVATQIDEKWILFSLDLKCCGHRINLYIETLSNFLFVSYLEFFFMSLYSYFHKSNKYHIELEKLANLIETKGNKVLYNNSIYWIFIWCSSRRTLEEYKTFAVKMGMDDSITW